MQCDGCYYQDRKENVCLHGSPIFDIDDNCTDYVEDDFVKKIRADERAKIIEWCREQSRILKSQADDFSSEECFGGYRAFEEMIKHLEQLKSVK